MWALLSLVIPVGRSAENPHHILEDIPSISSISKFVEDMKPTLKMFHEVVFWSRHVPRRWHWLYQPWCIAISYCRAEWKEERLCLWRSSRTKRAPRLKDHRVSHGMWWNSNKFCHGVWSFCWLCNFLLPFPCKQMILSIWPQRGRRSQISRAIHSTFVSA